jgi:CRP/FNR family transcriptional regulator
LRQHVQVLRRRVEAGQYLYRAGQPFQALYLIRVGSVKTCELAEDGREQVTGFRMAGELLGVESIGLSTYACDVVALESSEIWELPYPPVLMACLRIPELQQSLTDAMAQEIRRNRSWMLALGTLTAEQRVACVPARRGGPLRSNGLQRQALHPAHEPRRHGKLSGAEA